MNTIKRPVANLGSSNQNTTKYLHQTEFKGIVLNNNPYDVDQLSLKNAKNVYIDDNGTLVSRPPINVETLPEAYIVENNATIITPIVKTGYVLTDIFETGKIKVYISTNLVDYDIVAMNKDNSELQRLVPVTEYYLPITSYHISAIEQYIVVFNNVDAMILNINEYNLGWCSLRSLSEIPVIKRVVSTETFSYPKNQFTDSYKEEYVLSPEVLSILPEGTADVSVNQTPDNLVWTLENANINTEFRVLRFLNILVQSTDIITTAINSNTNINVVAVARFDYVMISIDAGQSFERITYPIHGSYLQVASLSKDGLYFFFVASDGVHRYDIADSVWEIIRLGASVELVGIGIDNASCFISGEVFTFALYYLSSAVPIVDIYWKGPNLANSTYTADTLGRNTFTNLINPDTKLTKSNKDAIKMDISIVTEVASVVAWLPGSTSATTHFVIIAGQDGTVLITNDYEIEKEYGSIYHAELLLETPVVDAVSFLVAEVICATIYDDAWYKTKMQIGETTSLVNAVPVTTDYLTFEYLELISNNADSEGTPLDLVNAYLVDKMTHSVDGSALLPVIGDRVRSMSVDKYLYIIVDDKIYTNLLVSESSAILTYTYNVDTLFAQIPTISYAGSELYLGFDNILKITANQRDDTNITFNLPIINNHVFTSSVNALINISTVEVAAFLINKVYVITTTADDVFGYRYDYLPTRLSIGVRPGDLVINTMDGTLTLYPTVQGLAVMTYQQDVANTDQVVNYVTNNIRAIWNEFYVAGPIKIVQMKDYVYLSNGTTTYLMLDLRSMTWWLLTSPFAISKITTNQFDFNIISNGLYKYDLESPIYKDVTSRDIEWQVESQPNPFKVPTYYKNLKQIIFQLEESNNVEQTILIQIKLYRKQFTLREPETIKFKIDSFKTVIKRFNYWKINELQWGLAADVENANPAQLRLNGLTIKYEISEEVRS